LHAPGVLDQAFDPVANAWSIWWLDGKHPGVLDPPVVGAFVDGVGTFVGRDTFGGRPILVGSCGRTSRDDLPLGAGLLDRRGETWEVNWIMESTRSG
jgi:hypothetical protein